MVMLIEQKYSERRVDITLKCVRSSPEEDCDAESGCQCTSVSLYVTYFSKNVIVRVTFRRSNQMTKSNGLIIIVIIMTVMIVMKIRAKRRKEKRREGVTDLTIAESR